MSVAHWVEMWAAQMAVTRVEPKAVTKVLLMVERKADSMAEN